MAYLSFKADEAKAEEIRSYYKAGLIADPRRPYDVFEAQASDGIAIRAYRSKGLYTVTFAGSEAKAYQEAGIFFKDPERELLRKSGGTWEDIGYQIGSDEVGVGDFFGGLYVCAVYLEPADVRLIDSLGVRDSKKIADSRIAELGEALKARVRRHVVRLSPAKLDELKSKKWSMHMILANAHNLAQKNLIEEYGLKSRTVVYIDQFEKKPVYMRYCGETLIANPLVFRTKGESYFPSVATASVLARYFFLLDWEKMEAELQAKIPKGAGAEVDRVYACLRKKYGEERLRPYVKGFFSNLRR